MSPRIHPLLLRVPAAPKSKAKLQAAIGECLQLSSDCSDGPHGPLGSWDVSAVTDMSELFDHNVVPGGNKFTGDISEWDVSSVTNMFGIFHHVSSFNADISNWDVPSVTDMNHMFAYASSFNGDISDWDVSSVTDMGRMFYGADVFN